MKAVRRGRVILNQPGGAGSSDVIGLYTVRNKDTTVPSVEIEHGKRILPKYCMIQSLVNPPIPIGLCKVTYALPLSYKVNRPRESSKVN